MADIRGIPTTVVLPMGRLVAGASPPAGFTQGHRYWPLAVAVDNTPVPPVVYILTADDAGVLKAVPASTFLFSVDNLQP
jgi:hypothetical protein